MTEAEAMIAPPGAGGRVMPTPPALRFAGLSRLKRERLKAAAPESLWSGAME